MLGKSQWKILDGEECLGLWVETSSVRKAANRLQEKGIINPKSGRKFSGEAVRKAALEFIFVHQDRGKQAMTAVYRVNGEILDDDTWKKWLVDRAKERMSSRKFKKFIVKYPHLAPYV